jgi:hypothetical protein
MTEDVAESVVAHLLEGYEQVTLDQLGLSNANESELIWQFIGTQDLDTPLPVRIMQPEDIKKLRGMETYKHATADQRRLVRTYNQAITGGKMNPTELTIVVYQGQIVDGHHRAKAAVLANKPVYYVDLANLDA